MNSPFGLEHAPGQAVEANVAAHITPAANSSQFLRFVATRDIAAFEGELLWEYLPLPARESTEPTAQVDAQMAAQPVSAAEAASAATPAASAATAGPAHEHVQPTARAATPTQLTGSSGAAVPTEPAATAAAGAAENAANESGVSAAGGAGAPADAGGAPAAGAACSHAESDVMKEGVVFAEMDKPSGSLVYYDNALFVRFAKPQASLKPQLLHSVLGGAVRPFPAGTQPEWPYNVDKKAKIVFNGELLPITDAIGKTVSQVYGFRERLVC